MPRANERLPTLPANAAERASQALYWVRLGVPQQRANQLAGVGELNTTRREIIARVIAWAATIGGRSV